MKASEEFANTNSELVITDTSADTSQKQDSSDSISLTTEGEYTEAVVSSRAGKANRENKEWFNK